jgi:hypothetical protein
MNKNQFLFLLFKLIILFMQDFDGSWASRNLDPTLYTAVFHI